MVNGCVLYYYPVRITESIDFVRFHENYSYSGVHDVMLVERWGERFNKYTRFYGCHSATLPFDSDDLSKWL